MCHWHSAGSLGWPFPVLKYKYIFQIKYTEAILSNSTRKLLWFEITKMLIAVVKNQFIVSFIIIFGTLSFPIWVQIHPWKGRLRVEIYTILLQFAMFSWWYPCDPVTADYENRPFEVILGPFIRRFLSFQRC